MFLGVWKRIIMIEQLLEQAKHHFLNVGSIIFLLLLIPIRNWTRNMAVQKIEKKFEDGEYIIYEPNFIFTMEIFLPLLLGGSILELILSSSSFPNSLPIIISIRMIFILILSLFTFLVICTKYIITNKRFFVVASFDFIYKFNKLLKKLKGNFFEISISEINEVKIEKFYGQELLKIESKNGVILPTLMVEEAQEIKFKIDNQIAMLNN